VTPERRITDRPASVRLEARADGKPVITGYAAVFHRQDDPGTEYQLWDDLTERVLPGCFDRALREGHDVRGCYNHDASAVLGRTRAGTMRLSADATGLRYEIDPPDTQAARDLMESIKRGDVTGSSFSFAPAPGGVKLSRSGDSCVRELADVDLFDVGPVTFPAYAATSAGMRAAGDVTAAVEEARRWREAQAARLRASLDQAEARARCVRLGL
jgi:HK97 family phage prohead protease